MDDLMYRANYANYLLNFLTDLLTKLNNQS